MLLLKFQRKHVLNSDSGSSDESGADKIDSIKLFTHKNKNLSRSFQRKFTETLNSFEGRELTDIDKKLLRGLNSKRLENSELNKDRMIGAIKENMLKKVELKMDEELKTHSGLNKMRTDPEINYSLESSIQNSLRDGKSLFVKQKTNKNNRDLDEIE